MFSGQGLADVAGRHWERLVVAGKICGEKYRKSESRRLQSIEKYGGDDGTRTRDLCRDSEKLTSTFNEFESTDGNASHWKYVLRKSYCVPLIVVFSAGEADELVNVVS